MKVCVLTLGCKVNAYESEHIKEQFIKKDYKVVELDEEPNIVVINTCTVTNQSDAKSRKLIRLAKRKNPNCILVVCGCSSEHHKEKLIDLDVDILIGNYNKSKIIDLVEEFQKNNNKCINFSNMMEVSFENMEIKKFMSRTRGFVKIQDGCNNYCSYCIIPYMRGNCRSKDINDAYNEIKDLVKNGYKEIVLTGIHTGHYGEDKDYDLVDLIRLITPLEGLKRIRISSIEITELTDKFIEELKNNKKICSHMHIPLQSGSNVILKLMNRKYTKEEYNNTIKKLRKVRSNISITTDLIVGFPNETNVLFEETIETIKNIGFTKIHVFPYSIRDNTEAAKMQNQIPENIKKDRVNRILKLSKELEQNYYNKFINEKVEVLIEDSNIGLTDNYIKVNLNKIYNNGELINVKIKKVDSENVYGEEIIAENKKFIYN